MKLRRRLRVIITMTLALEAVGSSVFPLTDSGDFKNPALVGTLGRYEAKILPILQDKCVACHSQTTERPFFYSLSILNRWTRLYVDGKIQRALASFEVLSSLSGADGDIAYEYATKIRSAVGGGRMPPTGYLLLHPNKRITSQEMQLISEWASQSADDRS